MIRLQKSKVKLNQKKTSGIKLKIIILENPTILKRIKKDGIKIKTELYEFRFYFN